METTAKLNRLRLAPRKMRLLAGLIKGKRAEKALALLDFNLKKGALPLKKLLQSALSNAKNNLKLEQSDLYVRKIFVDEGQKLKRWRARSKGRGMRIEKKTSSITICLAEKK
ncbi:MAG: 50S ribosomal protein L22 [Patescibacteria group bacterium]|nr:50S ribosomal protein L22 [Patescibacteria group bacterium]